MSEQVVKRYDWRTDVGCMVEEKDGAWVSGEDYDALRAEADEWQRRCQYNADTAHDVAWERDRLHAEAEALRAENERLNGEASESLSALVNQRDAARTELEAARGLLLEAKRLRNAVNIYPGRTACAWADSRMDERIDAFLTATPAPEVRQPLSGDISDQDWINAGCPPEVRQSVKQAQSVPGVSGIGRDADHPRALVLYLRAEPTDDDIRAVQEALRAGAAEQGERPLVEALEHYANCGRSGNVARVALAAYRKESGQ